MRIKFFIVVIVLLSLRAYSQNGIICSDNVNIRKGPSITASVIGKLHIGACIKIFDIRGTQDYLPDNIWDSWFKIQKFPEEWVNAFFVQTFPFIILPSKSDSIDIYNYCDISSTPTRITAFYDEYQAISANSKNPSLIWFKIKALSGKDIHDNKYVISDEIRWVDSQNLKKHMVCNFPFVYGDISTSNFSHILGNIIDKKSDKVSSGNGYYIKEIDIYNQTIISYFVNTDNSYKSIYSILFDSSAKCMKYGLNIGCSKETILRTLGAPDRTKNDRITYSVERDSSQKKITFTFSNSKVSTILWESLSKI